MQIIIVRFAYRFIYCIEFKVRRLTRKIHYRFNAHGVCRRYTSMRNPQLKVLPDSNNIFVHNKASKRKLLLLLHSPKTCINPSTTESSWSLYTKPSLYSFGMASYPYLAPRTAHATAAFVSASPPALTTASRPSTNDFACQ